MSTLKAVGSFLALSLFIAVFCDEKIDQTVYVRGVQCNISDKYVYRNFSCFPKSYSRKISTLNVVATFKKPMNDIWIEFRLFYKYGTIYREVMHTPRVDYCQYYTDYSEPKFPSPLSVAFHLVNDSAPGLIHGCPYTEVYVRNRTVVTDAFKSVTPSGEYKFIMYGSTKNGESIMVLNVIGDMNSTLKETFG